MLRLLLLLLACALASTGCSDPVSYSAPVGINLKAKSGELKSGAIYDEKGITTESGNPYGAFIKEAQVKLAGADPSRVQLDSVSLLLGSNTKGVTKLEEIFAGKLEVLFEMDDTKNSSIVAFTTDPRGSGPIGLETAFSSDSLSPLDRSKLIGAKFKVVLRSAAAAGFETLGAEADVQLTFSFTAYE